MSRAGTPRSHARELSASAAGVLTGFFGVGGGFLIVPSLVPLLGVPLTLAVGTSLLVIALTSAGALAGRRVGAHVEPRRLGHLFALLVIGVAVFLVAENAFAAV